MRPISDINIGDQYQRGYPFTNVYSVIEINKSEKMIKLQCYSNIGKSILYPFWHKNTNSLFRKRIYNGLTNQIEYNNL